MEFDYYAGTEVDNDICPHGMSLWLCAHPIYHYPTDEMMNSGRYY